MRRNPSMIDLKESTYNLREPSKEIIIGGYAIEIISVNNLGS
jgi:hypothetical protein